MNNRPSIGLIGINGYYTSYIDSYRAASAIYGLNLIADSGAQVSIEKGLTVEKILKYLSLNRRERQIPYSLYITDEDLKDERDNSLFGISDPKLKIAVLSELRLASEPQLARERLMKEAAHLIGHFFGLGHCSNRNCIMSYAVNLRQVDDKYPALCSDPTSRCNCGRP